MSWQSQAACIGQTDKFFPDNETKMTRAQEFEAFLVCNVCPVRQDCLRHSVETRETLGVWGGMTWEKRKHLVIGDVRVEFNCAECDATAYVTKGAGRQRIYCQRCRPSRIYDTNAYRRTNTGS